METNHNTDKVVREEIKKQIIEADHSGTHVRGVFIAMTAFLDLQVVL